MASRIEVCVRLRPDPGMDGVNLHPKTGAIDVASSRRERRKTQANAVVDNNANRIRFTVDKILPPTATQKDVYDACGEPFISKFFEGYNGTIMAYGQTGAGKTFTVMGPAGGEYDDRGLCARILTSVFEEAERRRRLVDASGRPPEVTLQLSALEIYNETVLDLLAPQPDPRKVPVHPLPQEDLAIYETEERGIVVPGLVLAPVESLDDALRCLFKADMARAVGEHDLNADSTRSHCIYTLHLTVRSAASEEEGALTAKLHIVDLAGSERIFRTGSTGVLQKEAAYINKSLSFLEQVVVALTDDKRDHIPYRQSKLTHFLKDSLNGNCRTLLIACVWPVPYHSDQTLSTLRFATRMMCIRTDPIVNRRFDGDHVSSAHVARLAKQVRDLKEELAMHDRLAGRDLATLCAGGAPYGELNQEQKKAIDSQVEAFLHDPSALPPILTLAQVRATYLRLRDVTIPTHSNTATAPQPAASSTHCTPHPPTAPNPHTIHNKNHVPQAPPPPPPPPAYSTSGPESAYYQTPPTSRKGRRRPMPLPSSNASPSPRYATPTTQRVAPTPQDPPTSRSYFVDSERETSEVRQGGGAAVMRREEAEEGEKDREGEGGNGGGAEGDREKAFAIFRLTETGTRDASVLKTVKARLRHVKERLRSASNSLHASTAELGQVFVEEEDDEEEEVEIVPDDGGASYAEGYMRRDARRRRQRLKQQVMELQGELQRLQGDKKAAVARMVKDFKAWWRTAQLDQGKREGDGPLVLPAVAAARKVKSGGMEERGLGYPPQPGVQRPWSMAEADAHNSHRPNPVLSSAQVSYEVARHQALASGANRYHKPTAAIYPTGRSPHRAYPPNQRGQGTHASTHKWQIQGPPAGAYPPQPHNHRRHSASL